VGIITNLCCCFRVIGSTDWICQKKIDGKPQFRLQITPNSKWNFLNFPLNIQISTDILQIFGGKLRKFHREFHVTWWWNEDFTELREEKAKVDTL
jgi:hypothetical protein